ncbi:flavoprotein [Halobacillus campisalis]|uniref:Flavoprotein n=1 Tax=Halobacillus campisalis TaxID=435909 RepID=A0ABW2K8S2_9BACI|nr:flavoprotein [Halobacillus campisalis]
MKNNYLFREFLNEYLEVWRQSSFTRLQEILSESYKAREIAGGDVVDFGYEEALDGWKQGFQFAENQPCAWDLREIAVIPVKENEVMAIVSADLVMEGDRSETVSLFFQTFKFTDNHGWRLIRSYIETGVPISNLKNMSFQPTHL